MWTGDGRVFFYNPTARLSVWERPAQLAGRADVDQAVAHPPNSSGASAASASAQQASTQGKDVSYIVNVQY